jgi:photosystem I P700 chlorophyll a apoprotein A1
MASNRQLLKSTHYQYRDHNPHKGRSLQTDAEEYTDVVEVVQRVPPRPETQPKPHQYILRHLFVVIFPYAGYGPCIGSGWTSAAVGCWPYLLDPVSSRLAITEVSDHHLALSVFLVGLGLLVRGLLPWRLGQYIGALSNAQLSLCLAGLGSAALGLSHHLYAMPPYPYLAPD